MVKFQYSSIPEVEGTEGSVSVVGEESYRRPNTKKTNILVLAGLLSFCIVAGFVALQVGPGESSASFFDHFHFFGKKKDKTNNSTKKSDDTSGETSTDTSTVTSSDTRACTFDECNASNCDHESAAFTCIEMNGGPHGGCSPTPWIEGSCDDSCDLSGCDSLEIPEDAKDCNIACATEVCEGMKEQLCPEDVPYMCLGGEAAFGCSDDKFKWAFKTSETTCTGCCDASKCKVVQM